MKTENLNVIVILMRHNADPSIANKENQTPLELAESKNRLDILDVLKKNSPLLQNSDETLSQGSPKDRIEDLDDVDSIEIPEQTSPTDPYSRYKNPEKVLKKLGRTSFEELPEHFNMDMFRRLQEPKVKEIKSKRLTPAERKKKKWTVTTAGEEQKKMQEMRAKSNQNDKIDTDSLLEEAEQAALKEQEERKMKNQKKKKAAPPPPPPSSNQKVAPKSEEPQQEKNESKELSDDSEKDKSSKTKEEKQNTKQKKAEQPQKSSPQAAPKKQPQNRGKKIKKDLKRVQSSSSSDDNEENDDDDDEIIVMPSFQNKPNQTSQSKQNSESELSPPTFQQPSSTQESKQQQQPQQIPQSQQQPSAQPETQFSLDQLKKFMDGYLSERQNQQQNQQQNTLPLQQPQVQYALPPGAYFVPAPGMNPQFAMPTMPQIPQMNPYNPMQTAYLNMGAMPIGMKMPQVQQQQHQSGMNVTRKEMQNLEARIASLEHIFAPAMRQFNMNGSMVNGIHLGTCQNCKTLNATSVCPRCGIQLCNGCRNIHNNQRCK